jgi:hypothetical protein
MREFFLAAAVSVIIVGGVLIVSNLGQHCR